MISTRGFSGLVRAGLLVGTVFVTTVAQAAPTLFGTGAGYVLHSQGQLDSNWYLGDVLGNSVGAVRTYWNSAPYTDTGFSAPASNWVGQEDGATSTQYNYSYKFDLSNFQLSTVSLSGLWSSDNESTLWLNGVQVGAHNIGGAGWNSTSTFNLSSGLLQGINLLQVRVFNISGPVGARLEFTDLAGEPVPEPFTMALGAAGIGLALKRRMTKKSA